ncbi:hypothetical protein GCG21_11285 [Pseudactinotalea sp. HY160]|uniref:hypothetical protein n=1 Tax=Pseudactinotalea sp. HY160 TaxID=2654490 RepID=UPI00128BBAD5|nr:hypothetical protein [Pseudactinotalea sp. HY160]MPV50576.1 hypothetical protein [Pseudactinotalea sp. HY160]
MKKRLTTVLIGGMAIAGFGAVGPAPAQAALTTHCVGEADGVTVPGDLLVPRGKACSLTDITVTGDVRVAAGADLVADGLTVEGRIVVQSDGYLDLTGSTVAGNVVNRGSFGVYLDDTDVRAYTATANVNPDTFLWTDEAEFSGRIAATGGSFLLESSTADRAVQTTDTQYTDIIDSVVGGTLTVTGAQFGAMVCGSEVDRHATFASTGVGVQLGAGGALADCDLGPSVWGGNVLVSGTTGAVQVSDNIIRGNLDGTGNDSVTASDNRVRGDLKGQFAEQAARPMMRMQLDAAPTLERGDASAERDALEQLRDDRLGIAEQLAEEAGPANL